jgi:glycerol uptake facilitator-like aquaporin
MSFDLTRRLAAEGLGTLILVMAVIGSGIMAENLAGGNQAVALLCNTIATGAVLYVIITIFVAVSGAHFNPAVSLVMMLRGELDLRTTLAYIAAQIIGGCIGAVLAHLMFGLDLFQLGSTARTGLGQWAGEFIATFGLIATILGCLRFKPEAVATAVGLYLTSAYWFTASTSFASPAVTIARPTRLPALLRAMHRASSSPSFSARLPPPIYFAGSSRLPSTGTPDSAATNTGCR